MTYKVHFKSGDGDKTLCESKAPLLMSKSLSTVTCRACKQRYVYEAGERAKEEAVRKARQEVGLDPNARGWA